MPTDEKLQFVPKDKDFAPKAPEPKVKNGPAAPLAPLPRLPESPGEPKKPLEPPEMEKPPKQLAYASELNQRGPSYGWDLSDSAQFAYPGESAAYKAGQELQAAQAEYADALMSNPLAITGIGRRVQSLANYLNAYRAGVQLPDQYVLPRAQITGYTSKVGFDTKPAQSQFIQTPHWHEVEG